MMSQNHGVQATNFMAENDTTGESKELITETGVMKDGVRGTPQSTLTSTGAKLKSLTRTVV